MGDGLPGYQQQDKRKWPHTAPGEVQVEELEENFYWSVFKQWNRLLRKVVESVTILEVFKKCLDIALSAVV